MTRTDDQTRYVLEFTDGTPYGGDPRPVLRVKYLDDKKYDSQDAIDAAGKTVLEYLSSANRYYDFEVYCYLYRTDYGGPQVREIHSACYCSTSVDGVARARQIVDVLARVERGLARAEARHGRVRSFGDYVARVAGGLGIDTVLFPSTERRRERTGERYEWLTPGRAADRLDEIVARARESLLPTAAEVAA